MRKLPALIENALVWIKVRWHEKYDRSNIKLVEAIVS